MKGCVLLWFLLGMEVLDPRQTLITNAEVLRLLQERRKQQSDLPKEQRLKVLGTVIYETSSYLRETPAAAQKDEDIARFIQAVAPLKLTAAETLQLINLRPSTAVEIQLLVEECEERLTEEQVESLVTIVQETLPESPNDESRGNDEEERENL